MHKTIHPLFVFLAACAIPGASLVEIESESPGDNCEFGGTKVVNGVDDDGDGNLDPQEVHDTQYVCNGADGEVGPTGPTGPAGSNGLISLLVATAEPPGENCPNGGQRIDSGVDTNADGRLDPAEITSTSYLRNGVDGLATLVSVVSEAPGTNCLHGGQRVDLGLDDNADGVLDEDEVDSFAYVCKGEDGLDGADGADGRNTLVALEDEPPGANCAIGGVEVTTGVDDNDNGTLDDTEVDETFYLCSLRNPWPAEDGIQTDVSLSALQIGGWSICYQDTYDVSLETPDIATPCQGQGTYVLLGCANDDVDPDNLVVAAADTDAVVLPSVEDGTGATDHRLSNGVGWYFSSGHSMGFFLEGDGVDRNAADVDTGSHPELRLSWHTLGFVGGYRCGTSTVLNGAANWSRYVLVQ